MPGEKGKKELMENGKWKMENGKRLKSEVKFLLSTDFCLPASGFLIFHFPFSVFR
jgi:hypothetical protein